MMLKIIVAMLFISTSAFARESLVDDISNAWNSRAQSAPTSQTIDVGFSPNEGALELVLKTIGAAKQEIRISAYSFTSAPITSALIDAKNRGVDIQMVADHEENTNPKKDRSGKARHALNALVNAGIKVRTIAIYPIHHDKIIIVDGQHVETGSFNYSDAAAHHNSENVIVLWNNPGLAKIYLKHWQSRYERGQEYSPTY
jgi:phosphatidylserine/phosphatidylglycerophosphate/cardiolipin synthase-like enzyme